jgi:hypothetical protein
VVRNTRVNSEVAFPLSTPSSQKTRTMIFSPSLKPKSSLRGIRRYIEQDHESRPHDLFGFDGEEEEECCLVERLHQNRVGEAVRHKERGTMASSGDDISDREKVKNSVLEMEEFETLTIFFRIEGERAGLLEEKQSVSTSRRRVVMRRVEAEKCCSTSTCTL